MFKLNATEEFNSSCLWTKRFFEFLFFFAFKPNKTPGPRSFNDSSALSNFSRKCASLSFLTAAVKLIIQLLLAFCFSYFIFLETEPPFTGDGKFTLTRNCHHCVVNLWAFVRSTKNVSQPYRRNKFWHFKNFKETKPNLVTKGYEWRFFQIIFVFRA